MVLRDAVTRAPVDGARILLRGAAARNGTTTPDGGFRFAQLASGDYSVAIEKSGYLDTTRGLDAKAVRLKPGAVTETVVVDLTPLGAMEGAVLGEDNKPLGGVTVAVAEATHATSRMAASSSRTSYPILPGRRRRTARGPQFHPGARRFHRDFYGYGAAQYSARATMHASPSRSTYRPARACVMSICACGARAGGIRREVGGDGRPQSVVRCRCTAHRRSARTPNPLSRRRRVNGCEYRFSLLQPDLTRSPSTSAALASLPLRVPTRQSRTEELDVPVPAFPLISAPSACAIRTPGARLGQCSPDPSNLGLQTASLTPDGSFRIRRRAAGRVYGRSAVAEPASDHDSTRKLFARNFTSARRRFAQTDHRRRNGNPPLEIELSDGPRHCGKVVDSGARGSESVVRVARTGPRQGSVSAMAIATDDFQFPELAPGDYRDHCLASGRGNRLGPDLRRPDMQRDSQGDGSRWDGVQRDAAAVPVTRSLMMRGARIVNDPAALAMPADAPFSAVRQGTPSAEIGKAHPVC